MAATDNLLGVGSQNHVSFIDPRQAHCFNSIANVELNQGNLIPHPTPLATPSPTSTHVDSAVGASKGQIE